MPISFRILNNEVEFYHKMKFMALEFIFGIRTRLLKILIDMIYMCVQWLQYIVSRQSCETPEMLSAPHPPAKLEEITMIIIITIVSSEYVQFIF